MSPPINNDLKEDFLKCILNFLKNADINKLKNTLRIMI